MNRTLAQDEARLAEIAASLLNDVLEAFEPWLWSRANQIVSAAGLSSENLPAAVNRAYLLLEPELERILLADPDAGAGSPLAAIRKSTRPVTEYLRSLGVTPVARDVFAEENFKDDIYDFGPVTFGDINEVLQESGLLWGAARAHVHLRRRREVAQ